MHREGPWKKNHWCLLESIVGERLLSYFCSLCTGVMYVSFGFWCRIWVCNSSETGGTKVGEVIIVNLL